MMKTKKKLFGDGYKKPITDEEGLKWCNCDILKLTSHSGVGRGQAYCLRCKEYWYN